MAQECSKASILLENDNLTVESQLLLEREIFRTTLAGYLNQFQDVLDNTCKAYEVQIQQLKDRNVRSSVYCLHHKLHAKISGVEECLTDRMDRLLDKNSALATTLDVMQMENTAADMRAHSLLVECSEKMENTVSQKMEKIIKDLVDARMSEVLKSAENSPGESSGLGAGSQLTVAHSSVTGAQHNDTILESFSSMLIPSLKYQEQQERDSGTEMEELWRLLNQKCAVHLPLRPDPTRSESLLMACHVIAKLEQEDKNNEIITLQDSLCRSNEELLGCRAELEKVKGVNQELEVTFLEHNIPRKGSANKPTRSLREGSPLDLSKLQSVSVPSVNAEKQCTVYRSLCMRFDGPPTDVLKYKTAVKRHLAVLRRSADRLVDSENSRKWTAIVKAEVDEKGQKNSTESANLGGSLPSTFRPPLLSDWELNSLAVLSKRFGQSAGVDFRVPVVPGDDLFVQMDISIAETPAGCIVLKLLRDDMRDVTDMFFRLCVRYACSFRGGDIFHIVPGYGMGFRPAEDKSPNGGTCPEKVPLFPKNPTGLPAIRAGLLTASACSWPCFTITMGPIPTMGSTGVVIGEVVEGMEVIAEIEACGSDSGQPSCAITITQCKRVRYYP